MQRPWGSLLVETSVRGPGAAALLCVLGRRPGSEPQALTRALGACRVGLGLHPQGRAWSSVLKTCMGSQWDILVTPRSGSPHSTAQCLPCAWHGAG